MIRPPFRPLQYCRGHPQQLVLLDVDLRSENTSLRLLIFHTSPKARYPPMGVGSSAPETIRGANNHGACQRYQKRTAKKATPPIWT